MPEMKNLSLRLVYSTIKQKYFVDNIKNSIIKIPS